MTNTLKTAMAASLLTLSCLATLNAHAVVTYDVQKGDNNVVTVNSDQKVLFYAPASENPQPVQFIIKNSDVVHEIPATTQDTFYFDASRYPAKELSFVVKNADGSAEIASGKIVNEFASTSTQTASLKTITNYSTAYDYAKKSEPVYISSQKDAPKIYYVRGMW